MTSNVSRILESKNSVGRASITRLYQFYVRHYVCILKEEKEHKHITTSDLNYHLVFYIIEDILFIKCDMSFHAITLDYYLPHASNIIQKR